MINVSPEVINEYLTDSVNKTLEITHEGTELDEINYYTGDITTSNLATSNVTLVAGQNAVSLIVDKADWSSNLFSYMHSPIIDDWVAVYFRVSFEVTALSSSASLLSSPVMTVELYDDVNNPSHYYWFQRVYTYPEYARGIYYLRINRSSIESYYDNIWKIRIIIRPLDNNAQAGDTLTYRVIAPAVYYSRKNMDAPIWSPAPDFSDIDALDVAYNIDNDKLLYEDFALTESLCSKDNIKFGLCESAHCEFKCVTNDNVNIGDDITIISDSNAKPISNADLFKINWVELDTSTPGDSSATEDMHNLDLLWAWGSESDWRDYIDSLNLKNKAVKWSYKLKLVISNVVGTTPVYFRQVIGFNYGGVTYQIEESTYHLISDYATLNDIGGEADLYENVNYGQMCGIDSIYIRYYDGNKNAYAAGDTTATAYNQESEYQVRLCNKNSALVMPAYSTSDLYVLNRTLDDYLVAHTDYVPLGHYNVTSVEKEYKHNLVTKHIEAYDKLVTLENNAADWYTQYMFGVDTDDWNSNGFQFARQIFSTYWNYVTSIGLDSRANYKETQIAYYEYFASIKPSHLSNVYLSWTSTAPVHKLRYASFTINNVDPTKLYMVTFTNVSGYTDEQVKNSLPEKYDEEVDPLKRGVATDGSVLVMASTGGNQVGYCVNKNDYFMVPSDCTTFTVYVVAQSVYDDNTGLMRFLDDLSIYEVSSAPNLANGHLRLCYYNYGTKNIFACESSITGRDVVRSLLEVCGCFFRLDRLHGRPEFVYPTKGGLYPSNTLYPADDLYPRTGTDELFSMGKYISVLAENYEVKDFGRIQILKDIKSSDTVSVCEWQYEGDPDAENTYIIDDNIFYCADDMEYDYGNMPEVSDMLEGMWLVISNLGFVPNVTQALGAPWLECGDRIGLLTYDGGFESFVFRRTLKGIQNLRDTYESVGDEKNEAINNFGY